MLMSNMQAALAHDVLRSQTCHAQQALLADFFHVRIAMGESKCQAKALA